MDEILESSAADEAVAAEEAREEAASDAAEPKAYAFDGWGLVPLEF